MKCAEELGCCASCGAPRELVVTGGTATKLFHRPGCTRTGVPFGEHRDTLNVIEQSKARDYAQVKANRVADERERNMKGERR